MRNFLLLFLFSSWSLTLVAQSDFREGYIITHDHDTVKGLLDFREASRKYRVCAFRSNMNSPVKEFAADEIRGYRFTGDRFFISREITLPDNLREIVFLEVIVQGKMSLYRHEGNFFVSKNDTVLHALTQTKRIVSRDGRKVAQETKRYIGLLNHFASDCPEVQSRLRGVKLFEKNLTNFVASYNRCHDGSPIVYKSDLPFLKAEVGAMVGGGISKIDLSRHLPRYEQFQGTFEPSLSPGAGISVDLSSPRINRRLSFHTGIWYLRSAFTSYHEVPGNFYTDRHYVTLDLQSLQIPVGLKYTFPEKKLTPYVSGGLMHTYSQQGNQTWSREREMDDVVETISGQTVPLIRSQLGIMGGIGLSRTISPSLKVFVEGRYSKTLDSFSAAGLENDARPSLSAFQLFIGIRTH